jgi:thiol-disulfide isomerase/thioredoxin
MKPLRLSPPSNVGLAAIIVGVVALAIGFALALRLDPPKTSPISAAPLFAQTLSDVNGQPQSMGQWKGRHLVVNFWATWCAPCVEEMPDLEKVQSEYSGRGVTVVGLAIDTPGAVVQFRDTFKLKLPLLIAGGLGTQLARELGNTSGALPYTVLVDPAGNVARSKLGQLRAGELRFWLDGALHQAR